MAKRPKLNDKNNNQGLIHVGPIPGQAPVASFNLPGIENLLNTKGFLAFHYKHALNPDREKVNGPANPNTQMSFRGLRYYDPRPVYHVPQGYKIEELLAAQAVFERGSVLLNMSGNYYDTGRDDKIVHARPRDLLIFPTLTDFSEATFEYNPTGPQKLQYKAKDVDLLFDKERDYVKDRDFSVNDDGHIVWLKGALRPDKGAVLSIVYAYTPIYIIWESLHNLRVIPSNSVGHGGVTREAMYAPQQWVMKPSTIIEEKDLLDFANIPPLPEYPASKNTTGGST